MPEFQIMHAGSLGDVVRFSVGARPDTSVVKSCEKRKTLKLTDSCCLKTLDYSNSATKLTSRSKEIFKYAFILGVG